MPSGQLCRFHTNPIVKNLISLIACISIEGSVRESLAVQTGQPQYQLVVNGRNTNNAVPAVPNLAGLLPGLSGLTGLSLPHGANLASLLASGKFFVFAHSLIAIFYPAI